MKVIVEVIVNTPETFEMALTRHVNQLLYGVEKSDGVKFDPPPQKNLDIRTTCPTSQTVAEIHTVGSTELNAEPPQDFKVEIEPKTRKSRAKKSDVVTKDEVVALAKAAIDPQDIADEKVLRPSDRLTHDDLRVVVGEFTKIHGIAKAQKMIPVILGCAIADVPEDKLLDAIDRIRAEITDTDVVEDEVLHATEADVREALLAYAKKYDADDDMPNTFEDGPKILSDVFGPDCKAIRFIPKDPISYGKALKAINDAIINNPFKRELAL